MEPEKSLPEPFHALRREVDPETGRLELRAARNMDRETITDEAFAISRRIVYQVAREGRPVLTTDALSGVPVI